LFKLRGLLKIPFSDVFCPCPKGRTSENSPPFRVRGKANFQLLEVPLIQQPVKEL